MKCAIALLALVMLCSSVSYAQSPKPFDLYAGVGMTFGSSPEAFKVEHKEGYHFTGGIGLNMIPLVQFVGKVEYHWFSKDFDNFRTDITDLTGGTRRLLMFGVDARLRTNVPTAPMKPFIFAGIGFARQSESDLETLVNEVLPDYETQTDFYFNIGGGLEFRALSILNLFIEGRYINIKQDGGDLVIIPVTVGIRL